MTQVVTQESAQDSRVRTIQELDLEPIVFKLMYPDLDETGLSLAEADRLVGLYRQFLTLCLLYPEKSIFPTKELDLVWHAHILDTEKYRNDCTAIFGKPLDHFAYLGMRGPEDRERLGEAFTETRVLFRQHFGTELVQAVAEAPGAGASMCDGQGTGCEKVIENPPKARLRPRPVRPGV